MCWFCKGTKRKGVLATLNRDANGKFVETLTPTSSTLLIETIMLCSCSIEDGYLISLLYQWFVNC